MIARSLSVHLASTAKEFQDLPYGRIHASPAESVPLSSTIFLRALELSLCFKGCQALQTSKTNLLAKFLSLQLHSLLNPGRLPREKMKEELEETPKGGGDLNFQC